MSKVIFLDIDGVVNCHTIPRTKETTPMGYIGVEDTYLACLKQLVEQTGAEIVLSSDWKDCFADDRCTPEIADEDGQYLVKRLTDHGLSIVARTNELAEEGEQSTGRGYGICKYLKQHPEVEQYVILDDCAWRDFTGELKQHFVHCDTPFDEVYLTKALEVLSEKEIQEVIK